MPSSPSFLARSRTVTRPSMVALFAGTAVALAGPAAALAPVARAASAAKQKSPKKTTPAKKKDEGAYAKVSATISLRQDINGGFGGDHGPYWQQLTVSIKDAKIPFPAFPKNWRESAGDREVPATWSYESHASTDDWTYAIGCDSAAWNTTGTASGKVSVVVRKSTWRQVGGKSTKSPGWEVDIRQPTTGIPVTTSGWFQNWDSILMQDCNTTDDNTQPGAFSTSFADLKAIGSLNDDRESVLLVHTDTLAGQTSKVSGTIHFSEKVPN